MQINTDIKIHHIAIISAVLALLVLLLVLSFDGWSKKVVKLTNVAIAEASARNGDRATEFRH